MAKPRPSYTVHQAAERLGVSQEEFRRGMRGLPEIKGGREHYDERELFLIKKWLDRNPKTGLTISEVAERIDCEYIEVSEAKHRIFGNGVEFVPEDAVAQVHAWVRHHRKG